MKRTQYIIVKANISTNKNTKISGTQGRQTVVKKDSLNIVVLSNPTPSGSYLVVFISQTRHRGIQYGPFAGCKFWIITGPMAPMRNTNVHIPRHTTHLPLPDDVFSAAQLPHLRPPASKVNVCRAMTKDHIADAMSPEFMRYP